MLSFSEQQNREVPDGLFLERFEAFMEKSVSDIKAFSIREDRPFDEVMRYVAEWHSKRLFKRDPVSTNTTNKHEQVQSVLLETSRILESLHEISDVHSFFLAVDASNPDDTGFLGGTVPGREYWRNLRRGGDMGFKSFKMHCRKAAPDTNDADGAGDDSSLAATTRKRSPANARKAEVYANVRSALRTATGVRGAEMKWSNPDRLSMYGVRMVGWPDGVPHLNPSSLTANQNKAILDAVQNGTLRFVRTAGGSSTASVDAVESGGKALYGGSMDDSPDITWNCDEFISES